MKNLLTQIPYTRIYITPKHNLIKISLLLCLIFSAGCATEKTGNENMDGTEIPSIRLTVAARIVPSITPIATVPMADEIDITPAESLMLTESFGEIITDLSENAGYLTDNTPFHLYKFSGKSKQHIILRAESNEFDIVLMLVDPDNNIIDYNDDSDLKSSSNAALELELSQTGIYSVLVNSFNGNVGSYKLSWNISDSEEVEHNFNLVLNEQYTGQLNNFNFTNNEPDKWFLTMPDEPTIIDVKSSYFDPIIYVVNESGNTIVANDDRSFIRGNRNPQAVLIPSEIIPSGTPLELHVTTQHDYRGGNYEVAMYTLPTVDKVPPAYITIKPVIIEPKNMDLIIPSEDDIEQVIANTNDIWKQCNIEIRKQNDIEFVSIEGLNDNLTIFTGEATWSNDEEILQVHKTHANYAERTITVYFVPEIDSGQTYGSTYTSLRYSPQASGYILLSYNTALNESLTHVLAHELGHILSLEHPDTVNIPALDGNIWNDSQENLMHANVRQTGTDLDNYQCIVAHGEQHYLNRTNNNILMLDNFLREDRVLQNDETVIGELTPGDILLQTGQLVETFYFSAVVNDEITIELSSNDFDSFLFLEDPDGNIITTDDDSGDSTNAIIQTLILKDGDYTIGVSSHNFSVGEFSLTFSNTVSSR